MQSTRFFTILLALVMALSALVGINYSSQAQAGGLSVSIAAKPAYNAAQDVSVTLTFSNTSGRAVRVLKWFTPTEDFEESMFAVSLGGKAAAYLGPVYKRPAVTGADYLTLTPGETRSWTINLSSYYDFAASGIYTLRYDVAAAQLHDEKSAAERLTSNTVQVYVEGRTSVSPEPLAGSTTYNKCTTAQQGDLVSARSQASTYSADALSYLNSKKTGLRYTTWFGVYDANRYSTVTTHFSKISSAMDTAAVTFDCGCKKKYYAYVYPTKPYIIYLCSVFWTAPLTGTDSKAGTLIHEMSHFNTVASTNDYVYGQEGAKSLAISNPNNAINNADNHEYFAENTPAQQ